MNLEKLTSKELVHTQDDVIVYACIRNEFLKIPYFLEYHRAIGVTKFVIVDNDSDDGGLEFLLKQNDCYVFSTKDSYAKSNFGIDWLNHLISLHSQGNWVLILDADEVFLLPHDSDNVAELISKLEKEGSSAYRTLMLDMYSEKAVKDTAYEQGDDFLNVCPYFDAIDNYERSDDGWYKDLIVKGGPRIRLFGGKTDSLFIGKAPLVKWGIATKLRASTHFITGVRASSGSGVILHFKFFSDCIERIETEVKREEHWNEALEYKRYASVFRRENDVTLHDSNKSKRFESALQLEKLGFINPIKPVDRKIFVVGLTECGSSYLDQVFTDNQLNTVNLDETRINTSSVSDIQIDYESLSDFDDYDVFLNVFPQAKRFSHPDLISTLEKLVAHFPDAIFILNYRPLNDWLRLIASNKCEFESLQSNIEVHSQKDVIDYCIKLYNSYYDSARKLFHHMPTIRLVEFDLVNNQTHKLSKFLNRHGVHIMANNLTGDSKPTEQEIYNDDFYSTYANKSNRSALVILEILMRYFKPTSMIDFGCGIGTWLAAAEVLGIQDLVGLDGPWIDQNKLLSKKIRFFETDLTKASTNNTKYDLAVSLEVAEHIEKNCADLFIKRICDSSDVVIFSAAIPNQGGAGHVNEQPQSYWIQQFESNSFVCIDLFRDEVWENNDVEFWYKQNTFLFLRNKYYEQHKDKFEPLKCSNPNLVHPDMVAHLLTISKERTHKVHDIIDEMRDTALSIEKKDVVAAYILMKIASKYRPEGKFMLEKLSSYKDLLQKIFY